MRRRAFIQSVPAAAMAAAAANTAGVAPGEGIRLGYDTYSIRNFKWKATQLVDYAGSQKLDTLQISSLDDFESLEPAHLQKVKDQAARYGLKIDGGIGSICPTSGSYRPQEGDPGQYVLKGLRTAKALGATAMRCFVGSVGERRGKLPIEAHMESTVKVLRSVRSEAMDTGVKVAIENHNGDLTAREVRTIIEEAGKEFVGSNLDTGNPMWLLEDPLLTLEVLGPYVVTTHIRDSVLYEHPRGAAFQWVALGDGTMDFPRILTLFKQVCPNAAMQLEIITGRPPVVQPYLEHDFWKAFPKLPAADFARYVALARRGHPFMGSMLVAGPEKQPPKYEAAITEQQRIDLERSFEYAKKTLGAGIRWKEKS
jgi:sugar phosphate isomerase/epimerase